MYRNKCTYICTCTETNALISLHWMKAKVRLSVQCTCTEAKVFVIHTNLYRKSWYIRATVSRVPYMKVLTLLNGAVQPMHCYVCTVRFQMYFKLVWIVHVLKQNYLRLYMYWNKGTYIVYVLKQRYLQVLAKLDVLNQKFGLLNIRKRQKNEIKYDKYLNTA